MAIVVIGGGAIGLLVAGRIAQANLPVAVLARESGAASLVAHGLTISEEGKTVHLPSLVAAPDPIALPASYQQPVLAIVCVKGYDTAGVLPLLDALEPAIVLTLQNGIGNEELLAMHWGASRVISGAITSSVAMHTSDHAAGTQIEVTKVGGVGLAPLDTSEHVDRWVALFRASGLRARHYADYRSLKWSKALLNMLGNATAAILDMSVAAVYADDRLVTLEQRALLEALAVMERLNIRPINLPRYPAALLAGAVRRMPPSLLYPVLRRSVAGGRGGKTPSLLGDLQRGRTRSEGEFLYGAVARAAEAIGMNAPVNRGLWEILSGIASGRRQWSAFRGHPEALIAEVEQH